MTTLSNCLKENHFRKRKAFLLLFTGG